MNVAYTSSVYTYTFLNLYRDEGHNSYYLVEGITRASKEGRGEGDLLLVVAGSTPGRKEWCTGTRERLVTPVEG